MNEADVRTSLNARLDELVTRLGPLTKHLRGTDGRRDVSVADAAIFAEMDEVIEQLDDTTRDEIRAVRAAFARLDNQTYGTCVQCGEAISPDRLKVLPATARCVGCAG